MNIHKNAKLTPRGRAEIVRRVLDQGQTPKAVATAFGVCERTVRKWVARYRAEGSRGLQDRSSRPHTLRQATPAPVVRQIATLRRRRCTGAQIAAELGVSTATVSRVLRRLGLNRLKALEPAEPVRRYERDKPGELIHIDIKKLGRFNRPGHRVTGDRTGHSNSRGRRLGVSPRLHRRPLQGRLQPDPARREEGKRHRLPQGRPRLLPQPRRRRRKGDDRQRLLLQGLRLPRRLQNPRPQAHPDPALHAKEPTARPSASSRPPCANGPTPANTETQNNATQLLPNWMHRYNWHRPHGSLKAKTPISRLRLPEDNLLMLHS